MQLGEAIRTARVRRGLTQEQLGRALPQQVHAKTVSKWERGLAVPRGQLPALEDALGIRLTNRPVAHATDPASLSNAELMTLLMRTVAEISRRLPATDEAPTSLDAETVLARGWSATRRGDAGSDASGDAAAL